MKSIAVTSDLYLIELPQVMEGLRDFISAWLYLSEELVFLVDPGPAFSINDLLTALDELGVVRLDYILLTHIHMDHAGGVGLVCSCFPEARVVCHPQGMEHLIDPEKLWQGSRKVLGTLAEQYGEIAPVPAEMLLYADELQAGQRRLGCFKTPGHAPHHLCFLFDEFLFAGEVAGIFYHYGDFNYQRPSTPPRFFLETSLDSLRSMIALRPEKICFSHYGMSLQADEVLHQAGRQLQIWTETVKRELQAGEEGLVERTVRTLLQEDPVFRGLLKLPEDIRRREYSFLDNVIAGMAGYLKFEKGRG